MTHYKHRQWFEIMDVQERTGYSIESGALFIPMKIAQLYGSCSTTVWQTQKLGSTTGALPGGLFEMVYTSCLLSGRGHGVFASPHHPPPCSEVL